MTLLYRDMESGKNIRLHSRYDPQKEADRSTDAYDAGRASVILVSGLALAYHINSLKKKKYNAQILVLEADRDVIRLCREINPEFTSDIIIINSKAELERFFESFDISLFRGITQYLHKPSVQLNPAFDEEMTGEIQQYVSSKISDLLTRFEFEEKWIKNIFKNIHHLDGNCGIGGFFGKFKGLPGIIVSAGPSLKNNIEQLKEIGDQAVIVAVDTAMKVLNKHGVSPHFVLTLDAQKYSQKHFSGVESPDTVLVADVVSCPSILSTYKGRKALSTTSKYYEGGNGQTVRETTPVVDWLEKFIPPFGDVQSGGSVATSAFDLLLNMGCDPIILMGQDLAYTGREIHCSGTYHNDDWLPVINRVKNLECINQGVIRKRKIQYVKSFGGKGLVISDFVFDLYKSWFEDSAGKVPVTVVNSTGGGASLKNTVELSLEDALDRKKAKNSPSKIIDSIMSESRYSDMSELLDGISGAYSSLNKITEIWKSDIEEEEKGLRINGIIDDSDLHMLFSPMLRKSKTYISRHSLKSSDKHRMINEEVIISAEKLIKFIETSDLMEFHKKRKRLKLKIPII